MSVQLDRRSEIRADARAAYARMVEIRLFEEQVNELFAAGLVHGTTHLCQGQEALDVALATVLRDDDVVAATYRGHGIALALGMTPASVLAEIMGRSTGCTGGVGGSMHLADMSIGLLPTSAIIGAGLPIATGAALAFQTRGEDRVAVAVFGDGASNIGAFHESLNMAAVWRLPVLFLCDNNVYGEYSRIDRTTAVLDLSRRAAGYDIPGESFDGMDVDTARTAIAAAVDRARNGGGPSLLEARTYRFAGHSRADKALYRPEGELEEYRKRDPIAVRRSALLAQGVSEGELAAIDARVADDIAAVVATVSDDPLPDLAAMFANIWTEPAAAAR